MKTILFSKYQGTGNDFVMIDNRNGEYNSLTTDIIATLCNRRFGIGADGLILLEPSSKSDFYMKYYNADGRESSMCGNGGRCTTAFAFHLGLISGSCTFEAIDGMHEAKLIKAAVPVTVVSLKMKDVTQVNRDGAAYILDTGSPHYVTFCEDTARINLVPDARLIRNSDKYRAEGINVNYVAEQNGNFKIRTYERGVEDETFSCGTGTVAAAIAVAMDSPVKINKPVHFTAPGGKLEVSFENHNDQFTNIWLTGEATRVFDGSVTI